MIIFGWGRQTIKRIGIAFKRMCDHCHNEDYWVLTQITTWFTLFFIPVIPYSTKYFLSCPVCQYGLTLDSKQVEEIRPLAETNQLLVDGKITAEEYHARLNQPHNESPEPIKAEVVEVKKSANADENLSFCGNCGTALSKELKFCGNCGAAVTQK